MFAECPKTSKGELFAECTKTTKFEYLPITLKLGKMNVCWAY